MNKYSSTGDSTHYTHKEIEDILVERFNRRAETDADYNKWFDYWWTERAFALARVRELEKQLKYENDYVDRCSSRIEQCLKS